MDELTFALKGDAPTLEQLRPEARQLPLLEGVIKESLRLMPPATLLSRLSTEPFELGPYTVPKDSVVTLSVHHTHRRPELFEEPLRFNPARWAKLDPSPYEYIPFGAGPRMCIGATFAQLELRILLSMMLQRYRLDVLPNTPVDYELKMTLTPRGGLPMMVSLPTRRFLRTPIEGNIHRMVDLGVG